MATKQFRALIDNKWYVFDNTPAETLKQMIIQNRPEISQFTGLVDNLDNKIFEGDVIEEEDGGDSWRSLVKFRNGAFGMEYEKGDFESFAEAESTVLEITHYHCVIVGNIYENPNLWTKK